MTANFSQFLSRYHSHWLHQGEIFEVDKSAIEKVHVLQKQCYSTMSVPHIIETAASSSDFTETSCTKRVRVRAEQIDEDGHLIASLVAGDGQENLRKFTFDTELHSIDYLEELICLK